MAKIVDTLFHKCYIILIKQCLIKMIELTEQELHSSAMVKLKAHLNESLAEARRMNDKDITEIQTAIIRGRIQFIKRLLAAISDTTSNNPKAIYDN